MNILASLGGQYENLVFYNRIMTLKIVVIAMWAGFIIAIAVGFYIKDYLGRCVRRLIKNGATSEDKAMTLRELGYTKFFPLACHLKDGKSLRRFVSIANESEAVTTAHSSPKAKKIRSLLALPEDKKVYGFEKIKLYIPEEKKYGADVRYEKKGSNPGTFIFLAIIMTGLAILVYFLAGELLTMLDNFITIVKAAFLR